MLEKIGLSPCNTCGGNFYEENHYYTKRHIDAKREMWFNIIKEIKAERERAVKDWIKPDWAVSQLVRETGLVEDVCEHGVGHPNRDFIKRKKLGWGWTVHGCCGCCSKDETVRYTQ